MGYNTLTKAANYFPGLSTFFFSELSSFDVLADPLADSQLISGDHTFVSGEGWKKAYIISEKHTGKATTAGSLGSQTLKYEMEVFIPGIDEPVLDFIKNALNDQFITMHRDADCSNPMLYQIGNACRGARMTCDMVIGTFEPTGEKGFTCKFIWAGIMYLYTGVMTMQPEISISITYNP